MPNQFRSATLSFLIFFALASVSMSEAEAAKVNLSCVMQLKRHGPYESLISFDDADDSHILDNGKRFPRPVEKNFFGEDEEYTLVHLGPSTIRWCSDSKLVGERINFCTTIDRRAGTIEFWRNDEKIADGTCERTTEVKKKF
jgi:hypothetical protein